MRCVMRCGCGHLIVNNEDTCVECRHNKSCHHTFSSVEFRRKVSNLMINTITSSSRYYPDPGASKDWLPFCFNLFSYRRRLF